MPRGATLALAVLVAPASAAERTPAEWLEVSRTTADVGRQEYAARRAIDGFRASGASGAHEGLADAFTMLGDALRDTRRFGPAAVAYTMALDHRRDDPELWRRRAETWVRAGDARAARAAFDMVSLLAPNDARNDALKARITELAR